jgi:hypothetical protein
MKQNYLSLLFILIALNASAQSTEMIKNLIEKKWHIEAYEISGNSFPASDVKESDHTIFFADHTAKSVDYGLITMSKWKYDQEKNTITLYSDSTEVTSVLKILVLNENEFVWETTNPENITMTIHMKNISAR